MKYSLTKLKMYLHKSEFMITPTWNKAGIHHGTHKSITCVCMCVGMLE